MGLIVQVWCDSCGEVGAVRPSADGPMDPPDGWVAVRESGREALVLCGWACVHSIALGRMDE